MTIALFSDSYLPTKSGIVTVVTQLRDQLLALGHRVILVTVETTEEYLSSNPDIYQVRSVPLGLGTDQFLGIPAMHPLIAYLKKCSIDVIHCHTEFGIAKAGLRAARILKIPAICTTHTMWVDFYKFYVPLGKWIPPDIINHIMTRFYGKFDALVGVSEKTRRYFKKTGLPKMPSVVILNAIDPKEFLHTPPTPQEREIERTKLGIAKDDFVVLFVGRVAEEKRIFELLQLVHKASLKNKRIRLLVAGAGPALAECKERTKAMDAEHAIIFLGFVEWSNLYQYYALSDGFITASLSETYSMTTLEAVLSGLPCLARDDECLHDRIIHGENGYLAKDDDELADYLVKLADEPQNIANFRQKSLKIAHQFHPIQFVARHIALYEQVIKAYPKQINQDEVQRIVDSAAEKATEKLLQEKSSAEANA